MPDDTKPATTLKFPGGSMLKPIKHRYFVCNVPAVHTMEVCKRLEDEGHEVVSVGGFVVPLPGGGIDQLNIVCSRIARELPMTAFENEVYENAHRKVQPVKGGLVS